MVFAFFLLSLQRLVYYLYNFQYFGFDDKAALFKSFFYGIKFDGVAIGYALMLFVLMNILPFSFRNKKGYQSVADFFYLLGILFISIFNSIDAELFKIYKKRAGADLLSYVDEDFKMLLFSYIKNYWFIILAIALYVIFIIFILKKINKRFPLQKEKYKMKQYTLSFVLFLLLALFQTFLFRGRLTGMPLLSIDAKSYVTNQFVPLILNTPVEMISTFQNHAESFNFMSEKQADEIIKPYKNYYKAEQNNHPNVCIIVLESFGKEYMGYYNKSILPTYTPFIDSLIPYSLSFNNSYANGIVSKSGIVSVILGVPALLREPLVNSNYQSNKFESLGSKLAEIGYDGSFYHGGNKGTMFFDRVVESSNFGSYHSRQDYVGQKDDDDGYWGIRDEPYFQYWCKELSAKKEPFVSLCFSLSNHDPYSLPEQYEGKFVEGKYPIVKTVQYTDLAVRRFFESAARTDWFNNTLFIITADHTSVSLKPARVNDKSKFGIPLIFYAPGMRLQADENRVVEQIDIMPSVLDFCNYPNDFFCLGSSIFSPIDSTHDCAIVRSGQDFYMFRNDRELYFDGITEVKQYPKLAANKADETYLKAYIQSYFDHLKNNTYY